MVLDRILVAAAGLFGAAGVAFSAAASHQGGGNVATAAQFLLFHAPALLAIGLLGGSLVLRTGAAVLLAGVLLFAGDLLMRHYVGSRLFPLAAPAGGTLAIAGWIVIGLAALARNRSGARQR